MDQETIDLIAKYRQYNPEYEKYTDQEITQLGLPGLDQSDNTQDGNKFNFMDYLPFGNKSTIVRSRISSAEKPSNSVAALFESTNLFEVLLKIKIASPACSNKATCFS